MNPEALSPLSAARIQAARVLVVGDVMLDRYWYGAVDRISPEAPVPVVRVTREEERGGGAANVALNVAALGAQAALLTVVGEDEASHKLEKLLAQTGVKTELRRDAALKTTVKLRIIGRQQQLIRLDFENTPDQEVLASQTARFEELLATHDAVLFSDYGKGGLAHVSDMITKARAMGKPVLIDPKGSDYSRYHGATVGAWHSEEQLLAKAQNLRQQLGLAAILLTRSEEGMSLFEHSGVSHVSAQAREVFDVTGAGDTVIATMAVLLGAGMTLQQALPWANRAGGVVVAKFGTATVTLKELTA